MVTTRNKARDAGNDQPATISIQRRAARKRTSAQAKHDDEDISGEEISDDDQDLPLDVADADYNVGDDEEAEEAPQDDDEFDTVVLRVKKTAAPKTRKRRQVNAKRNADGERIWKAIYFEYKGAASLGSPTASLNSSHRAQTAQEPL